MLFEFLVELYALLHSYMCFSLLEKLILSYLDTFSIPLRHLPICRDPKLFLITILTDPRQLVDRLRMFLDPQQLLNSWWIDRAFVLVSLLCSSTPPRQLHLSTLFFLIPSSTDGSTPINTSICRELLRIYIKDKHDLDFIFFRSLS